MFQVGKSSGILIYDLQFTSSENELAFGLRQRTFLM